MSTLIGRKTTNNVNSRISCKPNNILNRKWKPLHSHFLVLYINVIYIFKYFSLEWQMGEFILLLLYCYYFFKCQWLARSLLCRLAQLSALHALSHDETHSANDAKSFIFTIYTTWNFKIELVLCKTSYCDIWIILWYDLLVNIFV